LACLLQRVFSNACLKGITYAYCKSLSSLAPYIIEPRLCRICANPHVGWDAQVILIMKIHDCMKRGDRLCGLVVSVEDYKHTGPGFDSRALHRIFLRELGLERGPLSLVIG
jgi:hypothetical protein